jgi:hypothetical protein
MAAMSPTTLKTSERRLLSMRVAMTSILSAGESGEAEWR